MRKLHVRLVGLLAATVALVPMVLDASAAEPARDPGGSGANRCRPQVSPLSDLGYGGNVLDLTDSGTYVGHVSTGRGRVDLNGDGETEPDYRAAVWIGEHRLDVPSGFVWDQILDTTDNGWMLGFGYHASSGSHRSYVWRIGWRNVRLLDSPAGSDGTRARRINDHGEIVGRATGPDIAPTPLYWRSYKSRVRLLPLDEGGLSGGAAGINNNGQIVGYVSDREPDYGPDWYDWDAALWERPAEAPTRLRDHAFDGEALAINDHEVVVGTVMDATVGPAGIESYEYSAAMWRRGRLRILSIPPGTHSPAMLGVSDRGWAVGVASRGDEPVPPLNEPVLQPLLTTDARTLRVLPDLTGDPDPQQWNGVPHGVNDRRREVTGWASDGSFARAVVWHCASRLAVALPAAPSQRAEQHQGTPDRLMQRRAEPGSPIVG
jgi:uncharacterized membrane protein